MSEPTLYLPVFDDDRGPAKKPYPVDGYNWRGEKWGTWVPVEPDYKAAIKKSREAMSWADEEVMEGRMNDYDWWDVVLRAGVDAALRIGDNDEPKPVTRADAWGGNL